MTATESRITGLCSCCDQPMWADRFEDRGFRVHASAGVCSECPADVPVAPITVAGTEWVYTARGWEAPEDVETEGKVETVAEQSALPQHLIDQHVNEAAVLSEWELRAGEHEREAFTDQLEADYLRDRELGLWHADDQAAEAAGDAEVAL